MAKRNRDAFFEDDISEIQRQRFNDIQRKRRLEELSGADPLPEGNQLGGPSNNWRALLRPEYEFDKEAAQREVSGEADDVITQSGCETLGDAI